MRRLFLAALLMAALPASAADTTADGEARAALAGFAPWIGGEWEMQGSIQTFEWGLDRRSVIGRSWWEVAGERTLVSEGVWFWHPGEKRVRGYFTALQMPVDFLEYTLLITDGRITCDVLGWTAQGEREEYRETWEMEGEHACAWAQFQRHGDHYEKTMSGTFRRSAETP